MNIVNNILYKNSKFIIFEIIIVIIYTFVALGALFEFIILKDIKFISEIMFWPLRTGDLTKIIICEIAPIIIPVIGIILYKKKFLKINIICLIALLSHISIFYLLIFYSLSRI